MGGDNPIGIDDDVIVIDGDTVMSSDSEPPSGDALGDPLTHSLGGGLSENQRLFWGFVTYLLVGVAPGLLLAGASSAVGGWMVSLPRGQAPSPWVTTAAPWLPAATAAALVVGGITGLLLAMWSARTTPSRIAAVCLLFTIHPSVVLLGGGMALFGGAVAAKQPKPYATVRHPTTAGLRANVSRLHNDPCGWVLTESTGTRPMAQEVDRITCSCTGMPDAYARWTSQGPALVDASGMPYVCSPPPKRCATSPGPSSPLAVLFALLFRRRRERGTGRSRREETASPHGQGP